MLSILNWFCSYKYLLAPVALHQNFKRPLRNCFRQWVSVNWCHVLNAFECYCLNYLVFSKNLNEFSSECHFNCTGFAILKEQKLTLAMLHCYMQVLWLKGFNLLTYLRCFWFFTVKHEWVNLLGCDTCFGHSHQNLKKVNPMFPVTPGRTVQIVSSFINFNYKTKQPWASFAAIRGQEIICSLHFSHLWNANPLYFVNYFNWSDQLQTNLLACLVVLIFFYLESSPVEIDVKKTCVEGT